MPALPFDAWFTAVVDRYERPLVAYALRQVHDLESARDCVQDVFVRLHAATLNDRADIESRLAQWLFTVCRNRCTDHQRSHAVSRKADAMDLSHHPASGDSPAQAIERSEAAAQVLAALETLPQRQQDLIRLKFEQGLSYADIASRTKLSVTNVGFLLSTALATLRTQFANRAPEVHS